MSSGPPPTKTNENTTITTTTTTTTTNNNNNNNNNNNTLPISSTHILQLIQAHLTESGLHQSCRALQLESGVGAAGILPTSKSTLIKSAEVGLWGTALEILDGLDVERYRRGYLEDYLKCGDAGEDGDDDEGDRDVDIDHSTLITPLEKSIALAHEMTILELADGGEVELAYASLRMCSEMLDRCLPVDNKDDMDDDVEGFQFDKHERMGSGERGVGMISSRSGDIERRVTALSSIRTSAADNGIGVILPTDYYGPNNETQQKRRHQIAKLLKRHVPEVPNQRLSSLLQQSVKWQCFTGTFPTVERLFQSRLEDVRDEESKNEDQNDDNKKKKKIRKQDHNAARKFDLVLGNVNIVGSSDRKKRRIKSSSSNSVNAIERVPSRPSQTIRLGKKSYISSAVFLPDGKGLVTGSSDGFVEIWGEPILSSIKQEVGDNKSDKLINLVDQNIDFEKLRTSDLQYQKEDDLMLHDSSVLAMDVSRDGSLLGTASSDGTVCVWKIADGKLLRKLERAHGGSGVDKGAAVTCIQFSPNGSKLLTGGHDTTCREFGLLASRMLKEFRGHRSYVNCCSYLILPSASSLGNNDVPGIQIGGSFLVVVTGSADGTVRVWDGRTAEPLREITTPIPTSSAAVLHGDESVVSSKSIHAIFHLHSPPQTMIVVPRTNRAFLMSYSGTVLKVYSRDDIQECDFLAAAISPSNLWLYIAADDGKCIVFDVHSGKVEKIIRSFAEECCSGRGDSICEISGIIHHPHRGMIGGYSSDKGQKRGILTLWK